MSRTPLTPISDALEAILPSVKSVDGVERVPLLQALGRVLAVDQKSSLDVPPADNSAMDGYALRYQDLAANHNIIKA